MFLTVIWAFKLLGAIKELSLYSKFTCSSVSIIFSNYDVYTERHRTYAYSLKNDYHVDTQVTTGQIKKNYRHLEAPPSPCAPSRRRPPSPPLGSYRLYFCHSLASLCNVATYICALKWHNVGWPGFKLLWRESCYVPLCLASLIQRHMSEISSVFLLSRAF